MRKMVLSSLYGLAKADPRICFIGSDLGAGTAEEFRRDMPERFLMEGVSEAHIIGMAAGMAMEGKIPYVNTIATFLTRRCFEQLVLDLGLHNARVRLIGNGGGLVYAPLGPTHQATDDLAILRTIPNFTVVAPADAEEMKRLVPRTVDLPGPLYVRVGRGGDPVVSRPENGFEIGKAILMQGGRDALIVTTGVTLKIALDAARALAAKGIAAGVLHVHTIKPFDADRLRDCAAPVRAVVSVEEHTIVGGLGSATAEVLAEGGSGSPRGFRRIGIPDVFADEYGSQASLMERFGITAERVTATVEELLGA